MKIHSDILTQQDIRNSAPAGCTVILCRPADSRSREYAFDVRLSGSNCAHMQGLPDKAATYDEWGYFIGRLLELDERAIVGPYKGFPHFAAVNKGRKFV